MLIKAFYNVRGYDLPQLPTQIKQIAELKLWALVNGVPCRYITVEKWGYPRQCDLFTQFQRLETFTLT